MEEVTTIEIKEEGGEDDELVEVDENDMSENVGAASPGDQSTDCKLKLASMRCQDCGQQFTRWEAFKSHLRMHVLEEEDRRPKSAKRNVKSVPQKQRKVYHEENTEEDAESSDVDVDGVDSDIFESSWQVKPAEIKVRPRVAMLSEEETSVFNSNLPVYTCNICGKVYQYLESFRNHQKMHENETTKVQQDHKCPDCGKSFVRPSQLMAHLKVHRTPLPTDPSTPESNQRCEQCNKSFTSPQSWMAHMELHRQKPYWCLACSRGFKDEFSLDKHLENHNLKRHQCDVCFKSFRVPAELRYHYNTHTGDRPYKCSLCKKKFSQLGQLLAHRKVHVGSSAGASKPPLEKVKFKDGGKRKVVTEPKKLVVSGDKVVIEEENGSTSSSSEESGSESSDSKFEDSFESSAPEEEQQDTGKKVVAKKSNMGDENQNEEGWDCFECGMRFDQEEELHLHYMQHASGELIFQ